MIDWIKNKLKKPKAIDSEDDEEEEKSKDNEEKLDVIEVNQADFDVAQLFLFHTIIRIEYKF